MCRNRAYIGRERERERVFLETKSTCQETIPKLPLSLEKLFSGKRRAFSCMRRQRKRPTKPCEGEERHPVESSNLIMEANDWWDDLPAGAKPTKVEENAQKILSIIAYIGLVSAGEKHPQQRHVFVGNLVLSNRLISAIPFNWGTHSFQHSRSKTIDQRFEGSCAHNLSGKCDLQPKNLGSKEIWRFRLWKSYVELPFVKYVITTFKKHHGI